jgi:hypothetical protein
MEPNQNSPQTASAPVSSALSRWQWLSIALVLLGILLSFSPFHLLSDVLWMFGGMAFFLVSFLVKK